MFLDVPVRELRTRTTAVHT